MSRLWNWCAFCGKRIEMGKKCYGLPNGESVCTDCCVAENEGAAVADVDDVYGCGLLEDVICEIDAQTAADVAPVVRCMDCKHLVAVNVNGKGIPTCRVSGMEVAPDEFCSRGEKGRRG